MNLQFACADFTFPLLSHEKSLELIKMLGIVAVDIGFFQDRSHTQPSKVFMNIARESALLKKKLKDRDLIAADLFLQLAVDHYSKAINNPDPAVRDTAREAFLKTLEVAERIGAEHISILPGVEFETDKPGDSFKRAVDELRWRVDKAKDAGIILGIEAHLGSFCENPQSVKELVSEVKGLTLTLDYTHFTKLGISDQQIEILMPYASHFHARAACKNRTQTTLQNNTIDYARVMRTMIDSNYKGFVGLEYVWFEWEHMNETDNVSETLLLKELLQAEFNRYKKELISKEN
jgi:sugar phosphate isomerase/epimerase